MHYKIGMYGGSFDPLHLGHINCIIGAASMCDNLFVVLSYSRKRDSIPMEFRYRWLVNSFRHIDNIKFILLEDCAKNKESYDEKDWEKGRDEVLRQIGQNVDVVFCGSDYKNTNRYEKLYNCEVHYFERNLVPVSSTMIRDNPLIYWDYIPNICKPYFVKRVLFVGGESTGKSTITQNLAMVYNTNFVDEVGREVCYNAVSEDTMIEEDFHEILIRHKAREIDYIKNSNRILFEDTDALTTLWYSRFLLKENGEIKRTNNLAMAINDINKFDLVFFLEPTVPFVQDGTRNEKIAKERLVYSEQIKQLLDENDVKYICLDGDYLTRFEKAKKIINDKFEIKGIL